VDLSYWLQSNEQKGRCDVKQVRAIPGIRAINEPDILVRRISRAETLAERRLWYKRIAEAGDTPSMRYNEDVQCDACGRLLKDADDLYVLYLDDNPNGAQGWCRQCYLKTRRMSEAANRVAEFEAANDLASWGVVYMRMPPARDV